MGELQERSVERTTSEDALGCQSHLFSLPDDLHYLNCAYMSPLARSVEEAGIEGIGRKRVPTVFEPSDFFDDSNRLRELFARLIGGDPLQVAILPAASYGIATVARNVRLASDQKVLVVAEQFPSNVYTWRRKCAEVGAVLVTVAPPDTDSGRGVAWNEALLQAVDESTAVVSIPQVHWADGTLFDVAAIGARCREVGARFIIDGTQSVGALPFDWKEVQPDALVCAGYKTLFGPYSLGVAHYGAAFADGVPLEENWIGREGSENFSGLVDYRDAYQSGAARYDVGERSNPILVPMLCAALELVHELRPERVQAYCRGLLEPRRDEILDLGYRLEEPAQSVANLFGVRLPDGVSLETIGQELVTRQVAVSVRGDAIRVAPSVYNDPRDFDALIDALRAARYVS